MAAAARALEVTIEIRKPRYLRVVLVAVVIAYELGIIGPERVTRAALWLAGRCQWRIAGGRGRWRRVGAMPSWGGSWDEV